MKVMAEQLEAASIAIVKALRGTYVNPGTGKSMPVNGDLTKLKYVLSLNAVARMVLNNAEATTRKMSGTQETRRQMRFDTNALRVRYGVPIFVTFSPDEKHNLLMLRLSRTRSKDPVLLNDAVVARNGGLRTPTLGKASHRQAESDDVYVALSLEELRDAVPSYDSRRALILTGFGYWCSWRTSTSSDCAFVWIVRTAIMRMVVSLAKIGSVATPKPRVGSLADVMQASPQ